MHRVIFVLVSFWIFNDKGKRVGKVHLTAEAYLVQEGLRIIVIMQNIASISAEFSMFLFTEEAI